jgi:hypothetical protein
MIGRGGRGEGRNEETAIHLHVSACPRNAVVGDPEPLLKV